MRILYLTPTSIFSGGERVTLGIAQGMRQRGHEVVYCGLEGPVRAFVEEAGVPFFALPAFTPAAVKKAVRAYRPDLIHTMDYRASLYASFTGVPFIAHLHNNPPWLSGLGPNVWAMLLFGHRAGHIFTVSDSVMNEYRFGNLFRPKTTVLGNTVDASAILGGAACPGGVPEAYRGLAPDLLFFGRLTEQKDPLRFLELVAAVKRQVPGVTAAMLGEGEMRPETEAKISELGLGASVTMTGFLKNPYPIVRNAKLLVMPSKWEGFGLTCVESLTLGLPCLVSPVGGLQELVTPDCGKVCATDAEFVGEAVRLLTDETYRAERSAAAKQRAECYTDITAMLDTIESVCRRVPEPGTDQDRRNG
ncbi:MAG: glycosyltransferase [Clostridia bacterium]|nr:glycosyltransferase [Clostridia bacterium]